MPPNSFFSHCTWETSQTRGSQTVVPGQVHQLVLGIHSISNSWACSTATESDSLGVVPSICVLTSPPGDPQACSSLETPGLDVELTVQVWTDLSPKIH